MRKSLKRRSFLKGSGVVIALPMLEMMRSPVRACDRENRPSKRFICLSNNYGIYARSFFPDADQSGHDYKLPETLRPLERHRKDFTVFSNLDHGNTGGHAGVPVLLSGVRPYLASNYPEGNLSVDQKIAEATGAQTRFPSLTLRVNEANFISFTRTGVQVPATDLKQTYRKLFFEEPADQRKNQQKKFDQHSSILDVVLDQANSLTKDLGHRDRAKFEEYLSSVRSLEKKIQQQRPWLDKPKPETDYPEPEQGKGTAADLKSMMELIALAIQTDSTHAITLSSGFVNGDFGLSGGYHGFSHHGEQEEKVKALKLIEKNKMTQMAYLMDLLKGKEDPLNGGTLLDHTTILFGCGMATGTHSNRNLPLLLAGGGFKHGTHKVYPDEQSRRIPAGNLLLSILQNHGLEIDRFGTSSGTLTGLEWS